MSARSGKTNQKKRGDASVRELRARVAELEATMEAIRCGQIDALVVGGQGGDQVYTLQGAEHPYRVLVETMEVGAATLDLTGTVLYANARFAEMFGLSLEKCFGASLSDHIPADEQSNFRGLLRAGQHGTAKGDVSLTTSSGRRRLLRLAISPVQQSGMHTICIGATDLTELMEVNKRLRENETSLRQLSARLLQIQDDERRHIARDLHDVTGQKLASLAITLSRLQQASTGSTDSGVEVGLAECVLMTNQVSSEIRTLSYLLHPPLLDELGLPSAVPWYTHGFQQRTGIRVTVEMPDNLVRLPLDSEVALFRVIQESLANVHRHSGSESASVCISASKGHVTVRIEDHGKGMKPEVLKTFNETMGSLGVGIQGMRERIHQLFGQLDVVSHLGVGTTVTARIPITQRSAIEAIEVADAGDSPQEEVRSGAENGMYKRILIADDHEVLRQGVRSMLESHKDEWEICGEAVNGQEAVEKAQTLNADLVILDINMPVLNGVAAVRRILRSEPNAKILVFTVHDSEQTIREIREAGAHGYVSKSKAGQDLVCAVRAVLNGQSFYPPRTAEALA